VSRFAALIFGLLTAQLKRLYHGFSGFEGFENQVLDGLSTAPRFLSFEFNTEWLQDTRGCLQKPVSPSGAGFS